MPDGDPGRTVDEQVGERRRQNRRFLGGLVEVGNEVDGLLVEVRHQLLGQRLEPRLRVSVGRRRVTVDGTEVPLAVDQGIAHVEVLREPHQRVVRRRVSVRVVVADDFADDLRALAIGAVRRQPHLPHGEQHAAMRRLQAVAYVRKRPSDDYAHGVIHVRALHLVFDVDGDAIRGCAVHAFIAGSERTRTVIVICLPWLKGPGLRFRRCHMMKGGVPSDRRDPIRPVARQTSRFLTSSALSSMNLRRGST